jgi:hypothetical protein
VSTGPARDSMAAPLPTDNNQSLPTRLLPAIAVVLIGSGIAAIVWAIAYARLEQEPQHNALTAGVIVLWFGMICVAAMVWSKLSSDFAKKSAENSADHGGEAGVGQKWDAAPLANQAPSRLRHLVVVGSNLSSEADEVQARAWCAVVDTTLQQLVPGDSKLLAELQKPGYQVADGTSKEEVRLVITRTQYLLQLAEEVLETPKHEPFYGATVAPEEQAYVDERIETFVNARFYRTPLFYVPVIAAIATFFFTVTGTLQVWNFSGDIYQTLEDAIKSTEQKFSAQSKEITANVVADLNEISDGARQKFSTEVDQELKELGPYTDGKKDEIDRAAIAHIKELQAVQAPKIEEYFHSLNVTSTQVTSLTSALAQQTAALEQQTAALALQTASLKEQANAIGLKVDITKRTLDAIGMPGPDPLAQASHVLDTATGYLWGVLFVTVCALALSFFALARTRSH